MYQDPNPHIVEAASGIRFPFTALLGQEEMKLALILNAVNPRTGGILLRGEKGTAKSTAVRSLAQLLPQMEVVKGCPFSCDPTSPANWCDDCRSRYSHNGGPPRAARRMRVVELPLNATEEMVIGGLDFSRAVKSGRRAFMHGLLAKAHRGFLYVDEVNLLDDHLVDIILDAAASGVNQLDREGISTRHPADFVLVGSMNPEEGELRPQLLDRFGLCVQVDGEHDPEKRLSLLELRESFDLNPASFFHEYENSQKEARLAVLEARKLLPKVRTSNRVRAFIAALCRENHVAGHRADLAMERAARALAAYRGQDEVNEEDVAKVAPMALGHRRRDPLPQPPPPPPPPDEQNQPEQQEPQEQDKDNSPERKQPPEPERNEPPEQDDQREGFDLPLPERKDDEPPRKDGGQDALDRIFDIGQTFKVKPIAQPKDRKPRRGSGRRSVSRSAHKQGRYAKSSLSGDKSDLALDATVRAAAPHQKKREVENGMLLCITQEDLRCKVREKRVGNFLLFVVDASGSMGVKARMSATKGAILSLLLDAYQKRDKVALIVFRGERAELTLSPTSSVDSAARMLKELPVGGRTPLASALAETHRQLELQLRKDPDGKPIVIMLTDGKGNVGLGGKLKPHHQALAMAERMGFEGRVKFVVVDTEPRGVVRLGLSQKLAHALGAELFFMEDLKAKDLVDLARRSDQ